MSSQPRFLSSVLVPTFLILSQSAFAEGYAVDLTASKTIGSELSRYSKMYPEYSESISKNVHWTYDRVKETNGFLNSKYLSNKKKFEAAIHTYNLFVDANKDFDKLVTDASVRSGISSRIARLKSAIEATYGYNGKQPILKNVTDVYGAMEKEMLEIVTAYDKLK